MNQCHSCGEWKENLFQYTRYLDGDICWLCDDCGHLVNLGLLDNECCQHENTDFDDTGNVFCLECGDFIGVWR